VTATATATTLGLSRRTTTIVRPTDLGARRQAEARAQGLCTGLPITELPRFCSAARPTPITRVFRPRARTTGPRPADPAISTRSETFKTELIADRVWRTQTQLELAIVEYVAWFNHERLHQSLGDLPPSEYETLSQSSTVHLSLS
jgi:transposase InsO family protein